MPSSEWLKCRWCGWDSWYSDWIDSEEGAPLIFKLWGPYGLYRRGPLCDRCHQLKEPPWRPDNRDRCHEWLLKVPHKSRMAKLDTNTLRIIAEYLAENRP